MTLVLLYSLFERLYFLYCFHWPYYKYKGKKKHSGETQSVAESRTTDSSSKHRDKMSDISRDKVCLYPCQTMFCCSRVKKSESIVIQNPPIQLKLTNGHFWKQENMNNVSLIKPPLCQTLLALHQAIDPTESSHPRTVKHAITTTH